jgi:hypothetical protein
VLGGGRSAPEPAGQTPDALPGALPGPWGPRRN